MSGEDVRTLQVILNLNTKTTIALSGSGSPGLETTYFGLKTKDAVRRFQELHANDVLFPVGLSSGNGFVGLYSRAKLTSVCDLASTKAHTVSSASSPTTKAPQVIFMGVGGTTTPASQSIGSTEAFFGAAVGSSTEPLRFKYPSRYVVSPGGEVIIYAGGLTPENNTLHLGNFSIGGLKPTSLGVLTVKIPLAAPLGKFDAWISNASGESNKSFLIVATLGTPPPAITSYTPRSGKSGTVVSVSGSGFTSSGNEIYIGPTPIKGIASLDGKTLSFPVTLETFGSPKGLPGSSFTATSTVPLWFYVVNANGISNDGVFTVTFQ